MKQRRGVAGSNSKAHPMKQKRSAVGCTVDLSGVASVTSVHPSRMSYVPHAAAAAACTCVLVPTYLAVLIAHMCCNNTQSCVQSMCAIHTCHPKSCSHTYRHMAFLAQPCTHPQQVRQQWPDHHPNKGMGHPAEPLSLFVSAQGSAHARQQVPSGSAVVFSKQNSIAELPRARRAVSTCVRWHVHGLRMRVPST